MESPSTLPLSPAAPLRSVPPAARRRAPRRRLQAVLFPLTLLSLALAGGWFWEGLGFTGEATSVWDQLDPEALLGYLRAGPAYALWTALILGAHEMGHYLACRYYRVPATLPFFIPGPPPLGSFGAVIRIRGRIPHRRALFDIAAAGPIAGFAIALPLLAVGLLRATPVDPALDTGVGLALGEPLAATVFERLLHITDTVEINGWIGAAWVGMLVTSLNLFPVGQLDGGHAAYAISRRLHRRLTHATLFGLGLLILGQIVVLKQAPAYLVWFGILLWMRDRHPRLVDENSPLGAARYMVAVLLAVIFALSFIPIPLMLVGAAP